MVACQSQHRLSRFFDANFYSVPYILVHELVEVRSTATTVEIFHKGQRVASHLRARGRGQTVTIAEHRPESSGTPGMDAFAHGALGRNHRPHSAAV